MPPTDASVGRSHARSRWHSVVDGIGCPRPSGRSPLLRCAPARKGVPPVGAICHGPWSLGETGIVTRCTLTSFPRLRIDIRNAGGTWVDEEAHTEDALGTRRPGGVLAHDRGEVPRGGAVRRDAADGAAT